MIRPSTPGVSRSALWLAGALTLAARHEPWRGARVPPEADSLFRAGAADAGRFLADLEAPDAVAGFIDWFECRYPGFVSHVAPRKRWVAERVDRAVSDGAASVVVLGGGLDPLSVTLVRSHPGLAVVDLDRPPTAAVKRAALAALGPRPGLRVVAADLADDTLASDVAELPGPMLVVAEGLFEYFPLERVERTLATLGACGMRWLVASFMAPSALDDPVIRRTVAATRGGNAEPFQFLVDGDGFARVLGPAGLVVRSILAPEALAGVYATSLGLGEAVPPIRPLAGFHLASAEIP